MKNKLRKIIKNKHILGLLIATVTVGIVGYFVFADNTNTNNKNQSQKINEQQKKQTQNSDFEFVSEIEDIPQSKILTTDDWKKYKHPQYATYYPSSWHVIEEETKNTPFDFVAFSTSASGNAADFNDEGERVRYKEWARIDLDIRNKKQKQTMLEFLKEEAQTPSPGYDASIQKIRIGDKEFFGSTMFQEKGSKNAYFALSDTKVLVVRYQLTSGSEAPARGNQIYYTVLNSLRIK